MNTPQPVVPFKEAIALGKYQPEYLEQYSEWQQMDRQLQFQYISQAVINKRRQLRIQWANLANQPNFSKKPQLAEAQKKVEQALRDLDAEEEKLMVEYAGS